MSHPRSNRIAPPWRRACVLAVALCAPAAAARPAPFAAPTTGAPAQTIGHIQIVTDLQSLPAEYRDSHYRSADNPLIEQLVTPNSAMLARLRAALDRLPPILYGSISKLSVGVYETDDQIAGDTYGNNIVIAKAIVGDQQELNHTIAHEATHCFQGLMEVSHHTDFSNVTPAAKAATEAASKALREVSVNKVLRRLQSTAPVADPGYPDYAGDAWEDRYTSTGAAVADGFVSPYAAEEPREDLAEIVATFVDGGFAEHLYCTQFEGLDGRVDPQQVLAFAKLNVVRTMGLIDDGQYRTCVRDADPVDARVIHMGSREFGGNLHHGTQDVSHPSLDDDWKMWRIAGEASDARLELRLRLRKVHAAPIGTAIGFYELDTAGSHGMAADRLIPIAAQNVITFQRTGTSNDTELAAYTRISGGGYALITDFSADRVKGYAFNVPFYSIIDIDALPTDTMDVIWFLWER